MGAVAGALAAAWVLLTVVFDRHIQDRVGDELGQRWLELAASLEIDGGGELSQEQRLADPRYQLPFGGAYWQVEDGPRVLLKSKSLLDADLPVAAGTARSGRAAIERHGPNGAAIDLLVRPLTLRVGGQDRRLSATVALGSAGTDKLRASFGLDTALALAIIGTLLAVAASVQIELGLRPLAALRARLLAVHANEATRLEGAFPSEVDLLVTDLNRLLAGRREQVDQARKRAGDLAHALKTPLTIVEGEADAVADAGALASAEAIRVQVAAMRRQVDRALARTRTHALASTGALSADLGRLTFGLLGLMRRMPNGDRLDWIDAVPPGTAIPMDADDAGECLGNLLDNARKWARRRVWVSAASDGARVTVSVLDDGPGLDACAFETLRQRGAQAVPGQDGGSGLGLAIVDDVLEAYGSRLYLERRDGGGLLATFTVAADPRAG